MPGLLGITPHTTQTSCSPVTLVHDLETQVHSSLVTPGPHRAISALNYVRASLDVRSEGMFSTARTLQVRDELLRLCQASLLAVNK